jgi:hypothetical protein
VGSHQELHRQGLEQRSHGYHKPDKKDHYSIIVETGLDLITGKFAAVVVVAAGLFFVLFPFNGTAQMAIGDQLIRVATIMWNGAP